MSCSRVFVIAVMAAIACQAGTITFNTSVPGTSNIFTADGNAVGYPFAGGASNAGTNAVLAITFPAATGFSITFPVASGLTGCYKVFGVPITATLADGNCRASESTNVNSVNGISGIDATGRNFFLVGLFLDGATPTSPAPASLTYANAAAYNAASYSPEMGQVFFIGNGHEGIDNILNPVQTFNVPGGATQLFLGFVDANNFTGTPGSYGDDSGLIFVHGILNTPEPATCGLLGAGLAALAFLRRRQRQS